MTDNEIIKALECCIKECDYEHCPYYVNDRYECGGNFEKDIFDLINRQKAELEVKNKLLDIAEEKFETIKADTIQEFIKRFEKKIKDVEFTIGQAWEIKSAIKEVVKEMVGDDNG